MENNLPTEKKFFLLPLVYGFCADMGGSVIGGFIVGALIGANVASTTGITDTVLLTQRTTEILSQPIVLGSMMLVGVLFSLLGGYIAGRTAKSNKLFHAEVLGYIFFALSLISTVAPPLVTGTAMISDVLLDVALAVITFLTIYAGGRIASHSVEPEMKGILGPFLSKIPLHGKALFGILTILVIVTVFASAFFKERPVACNVETIYVYGTLYTTAPTLTDEEQAYSPETYSAGVASIIDMISESKDVKAILVDIDSGGGSPVAGEEIANALKRSEKPVVAIIRSVGASSAYWAATGADTIFASTNADVGGIGVSVNYVDSYEKNRREGLNSNIVSSAKFKSLGDPNQPLTDEQRRLLQRDVDEIHNNFVKAVSENRNISLSDTQAIADGATVLGSKALEQKLIDKIGDMSDVKKYLEELIGEEPKICDSYYPQE